jgi:hypothetical protein
MAVTKIKTARTRCSETVLDFVFIQERPYLADVIFKTVPEQRFITKSQIDLWM